MVAQDFTTSLISVVPRSQVAGSPVTMNPALLKLRGVRGEREKRLLGKKIEESVDWPPPIKSQMGFLRSKRTSKQANPCII